MSKENEIVVEAKQYAEEILSKKLPEVLTYHNLGHTYDVVGAISVIGANEGLNKGELEIAILAGWFHDIGLSISLENHEEHGAKLAREFLTKNNYDKDRIDQVATGIMATQMPQCPKNKIQQVICDADLYHLSTVEYFNKAALLKEEWEKIEGKKIGKKKWLKTNKDFLSAHQYFTKYGKKEFSEGIQRNLELIDKKLAMSNDKKQVWKLENKIEKLEAKLLKSKEDNPERGMQTMFRITSKNHLELSAMADSKANIMISINSIILSILVSVLFRKLEEFPHMIVPTVFLTVVCLITIVFAVLATRPNISRGTFTREDIHNKKTNLLFFGNFHSMGLNDYTWAMNELMKDGEYLYNSLIKDIYFLGNVLGKKYKFLRISYTVFMFGFVISVVSFIVAELFFKEPLF